MLFERLDERAMLSGLTVLTHGYQLDGDFPVWVDHMRYEIGTRVAERGGDSLTFDLAISESGAFRSFSQRGTADPRQTEAAEALVMIDWASASNNDITDILEPFVSTSTVALSSLAALLQAQTIAGATVPLAELPIHLIGHSRGASVMAALGSELGRRGIWVDQFTGLDPHPYDSRDAGMTLTSNVIFADNYWRDANWTWPFNPWGQSVNTAADFSLDLFSPGLDHSDVHEFYRGTIDSSVAPTSWYNSISRDQVGFAFSRIARGDRTVPFARPGLLASFGGTATGRFVPSPLGAQWPNVADVQFTGTSFSIGDTADVQFKFGDRDSSAVVSMFLDQNENPYDDNSEEVANWTMAQADFATGSGRFSTAGIPPGTYRLGAKVTDGGRTRYSYALRDFVVVAPPLTAQHRLFFPEGYRSGTIDEYVPMVNPGTSPVSYEVYAHYETGARDQLLWSGVIPPRTRAGIEVALKNYPASALVREGVPYALEIRSSGPLGATMSHYDFGVATGEAFTSEVSGVWSFPLVTKQPGSVLDFLTVFNPQSTAVQLTATVYPENGAPVSISWGVEALRRTGLNFDAETWVPTGRFAVVLTASSPVVASLSHYETRTGQGFLSLGEAASATDSAQVPYADLVSTSVLSLAMANTGSDAVTVSLTVHEEGAADRILVPRTLPSKARLTLTNADLGIAQGKRGYVSLTASHPVVVCSAVNDNARADSLGMPGATRAARSWSFADGYFVTSQAGTNYFETLAIGNPLDIDQLITIDFLFEDGTSTTLTRTLGPRSSQTLSLHAEPALLARGVLHGGEARFATVVTAPYALMAAMTHWDLFYQGGWATLGTPMDYTIVI